MQYDSIYIDKFHSIDRGRDTVFVVDNHVEYRYKLLRDTCYVHQVDSIPVIQEVEVIKTKRYTPAIYKWSLGICIALIILIILYIVWKIKF